jgi:hypothetical protein
MRLPLQVEVFYQDEASARSLMSHLDAIVRFNELLRSNLDKGLYDITTKFIKNQWHEACISGVDGLEY